MGWFSDEHPGHEGYLVAFVPRHPTSTALWRELGFLTDTDPQLELARLAVACDCGWRSPHFHPPFGTIANWYPSSVELEPKVDNASGREMVWRAREAARALWWAHCQAMRAVPVRDACALLTDLVAGARPSC